MTHSTPEKVSLSVAKFFATTAAFWLGISVAALWMLSWVVERTLHEFLLEAVGMLSFLTIFVFQRAQNKDLKAVQIKLDELIASSSTANNRLIKAEEAPEHVLEQVHEIYKDVARAAMDEDPRARMVDIAHAESLMEALHKDGLIAEKAAAAEHG